MQLHQLSQDKFIFTGPFKEQITTKIKDESFHIVENIGFAIQRDAFSQK